MEYALVILYLVVHLHDVVSKKGQSAGDEAVEAHAESPHVPRELRGLGSRVGSCTTPGTGCRNTDVNVCCEGLS